MSKILVLAVTLTALALVPIHATAASFSLDRTDDRDDVYQMTPGSGGAPELDVAEGHDNIDLVGAWTDREGDDMMFGLRVVGTIEKANHASGDSTSMSGAQFLYSFSVEYDGDADPEFFVEYSDGKAHVVYKNAEKGSDAPRMSVPSRAVGSTLLIEVPQTMVPASAPRFDFQVAAVEHQADYTKGAFNSQIFVDILGDFPEYPELHTTSEKEDVSIFEAPAPTLALAAAAALAGLAFTRRR